MSHKPNIRLVKKVPDSAHVVVAPFLPIYASTLKIRDNIAELAEQERRIMIATVASAIATGLFVIGLVLQK